jgi:hypothetical protein
MHEGVTRSNITPPPQSEWDALVRLGCELEEKEDGLLLTYPARAIRETINEQEGRHAVFFVHQYEQRQVTELYNRFTKRFIIILKPSRYRS